MPQIRPIRSIRYDTASNPDVSSRIAPPYDVLNEPAKAGLLEIDAHNIVAIDLPHLPPKTVGPDSVYEQANDTLKHWLEEGVLTSGSAPAVFVYQQTYTAVGAGGGPPQTFKRRGLITNVGVQAFGESVDGLGTIFPHEQTFSGPKEDRMKLMYATQTQMSPIFGLYSDPAGDVQPLLAKVVERGPADFYGTTANDGVRHDVWVVEDPAGIGAFSKVLSSMDLFIADGHHRYTTALNYRQRLIDEGKMTQGDHAHPADSCMFVLVAMQDPGMIVLPTHRVLGGMAGFGMDAFIKQAEGKLRVTPFEGKDLEALEAALPGAGSHAMGLYDPSNPTQPLAIATTVDADPLMKTHPKQSEAWRSLDVAVLQHLIVEGICEPGFCKPSEKVAWKFPHSLEELVTDCGGEGGQIGVVMQPTPLESVRQVSEAGELMPQKSTFFYPKLATGLAINPLS